MTGTKLKKWLLIIAILLGIAILLTFLGPKPSKPDFSSLALHTYTSDLKALEDSLAKSEASFPLKPDNEARIVWAKPYEKTPYSMVYLHGNVASQEEGDPIHEALADRFGCNLYLSRLKDHGLEGDDLMRNIDPVAWMQSALDAIAMGKAIGEKVIVISCSTGSTLALYLASKYPDLVEAQIMMSPNVDIFDPRSAMMTSSWGLQKTRIVLGSKFYSWEMPDLAQPYWYNRYRIEGLVTLKSMIDATMTNETFVKIDDPLLLAYYYHDEEYQDKVVSVARMKDMYSQISTPAALKREAPISDAGTHIIGSDLFNTKIESVWTPIEEFCQQVLKLTPVKDSDWRLFLDFRRTN